MNKFVLVALAGLAVPASAWGQTGYSITGGLSNFDCGNHCDTPCNEFEIEIEDITPEDVVHCYHNGNYGAPTITLKPGGGATIIDYRNPNHPTSIGSIEHFGVSLRVLSSAHPIRVRWMVSGAPATVNGQVPVPGGSAPATQPMLPSITADKGYSTEGDTVILVSVTNNDPGQAIWVKRKATITSGSVQLESLMTNNALVVTSLQIDPAPVYLPAGATLDLSNDTLEFEGDQSIVVSAQYYQNLAQGGPFGQNEVLGPELGNVMTATIASPESACAENAPLVTGMPASLEQDAGTTVRLQVQVQGDDLPHTIQWYKEGVALSNGNGYSGVTGDELEIDELNAATEGFYSVKVSNACGSFTSPSALVFITGHNEPPPRVVVTPCNASDITDVGDTGAGGDGQLTVDDLIAFVNDFSSAWGCPGVGPCNRADLVGVGGSPEPADGELTVDDLIEFVNVFSQGC